VTATLARGLTPVRVRLSNGAVLTAQENPAAPAVVINASFQAGSVYDPPDLPGLAYLVARVMDRGTARRSGDAIARELDGLAVGLRIAAARHSLTLSCTCLVEDFEHMLELVLDIARGPTFPDEELAKRRAEAITRLRQDEDNPGVRAMEELARMLYGPEHPYGRPAKGTPAAIERMTREDLAAFHVSRVLPQTLSLVIVGDLPPSEAIASAAAEIEGWAGGSAPTAAVPPPPLAAARRESFVPMPGKAQSDIAYGFTTITRLDPRFYAYSVANHVLGQFGLGGRLADNIRERQGMAYYAFSAIEPSHGVGPLLIRAGVAPGNVDRAIAAIDEEVARLGAEGPTPAELADTRDALIGSIPRMLETNHSIATFLQITQEFDLGLDYDRRLVDRLRAVTPEEVRRAAAEVLDPARACVAVAGPPEG
jgi:zinc protease